VEITRCLGVSVYSPLFWEIPLPWGIHRKLSLKE